MNQRMEFTLAIDRSIDPKLLGKNMWCQLLARRSVEHSRRCDSGPSVPVVLKFLLGRLILCPSAVPASGCPLLFTE
jgi:hypothetical protein